MVTGLVVLYVAFVALVFFLQSRLIYFPVHEVAATPQMRGLAFESARLRTADGPTLDAWYIPAASARGVVLFCHGNAGNISHRLESIAIFHSLGLDTLIFDYRGYGRSTGRPSEEGTYRDAAAAWRYLVEERKISPDRIVVFGRSLGAAVATWLVTQQHAAALIAESAFTSVPDLAADIYPWLPVRWLARFNYDSLDRIARLELPILVVHSRDDEIIPMHHGQRLFDAARGQKRLLEIRGGHNEGFYASGAVYREGLNRFFDEVLGARRVDGVREGGGLPAS
jgi:hypothetical protein